MSDQHPAENSRRHFLKITSIGGAAAVGGAVGLPVDAEAAGKARPVGATTLPYPNKVVGAASKMQTNVPVKFDYPDVSSPCVAIKMGKKVAGGVGPDGDIVAYSILCTHMGCPVNYDAAAQTFRCPCHFSMFDAEMDGQMICGQATENLPRIELSYDAKSGSVTATGVNGLIYGRASNIL